MDLVDIGANLTHESFTTDLAEVIARARAVGVTRMIVTGADLSGSAGARALARGHPGVLYATAGVHPHCADQWQADSAAIIRRLAEHPEVVAIGETGLDFNRDFSPRADQERAFEAQLQLASELGLPVFMHERDAHQRFAAILSAYRHRLSDAVAHCFTGDAAALDAYLALDLHIGITGWICDERRGLHLRELVARIPTDRLLIETDAPYLLPRDLKPRPRGRRNEPMHLPHILATVAACRGISTCELARATTANAERFFHLNRR